ncbi:MAG TPA: hypothetical protein VLE02_00970 [Nitrosarchaeum sp.]|nr:hypothetical protein [Nitrosarchaeum sp.]
MYRYSFESPNQGYYQRWIQGSSGMNDGMPLWSNEYSFTTVKHGSQGLNPYRGNVKDSLSPDVNVFMKDRVKRCIDETMNPSGCELSVATEVLERDKYQKMQKRPEFSRGTGKSHRAPRTAPPTGHRYRRWD